MTLERAATALKRGEWLVCRAQTADRLRLMFPPTDSEAVVVLRSGLVVVVGLYPKCR